MVLNVTNNPKCPRCNITIIKWHEVLQDGKIKRVCRGCKREIVRSYRAMGIEYKESAVFKHRERLAKIAENQATEGIKS